MLNMMVYYSYQFSKSVGSFALNSFSSLVALPKLPVWFGAFFHPGHFSSSKKLKYVEYLGAPIVGCKSLFVSLLRQS